jgi:Mesyanzhinovviridae DNA primase
MSDNTELPLEAEQILKDAERRAKAEKKDGPRADHDGDDDEKDLTEMNAKYAVVKVGGKTRVVEFEESPTYPGCKVPVFSTIADFCAFHAKRKKRIPAVNGSKEVGIGKWWIDHPKRQQFERVAYLPGFDNSHVLNLWRGFAVEPKEGNCDLYLAHLRENICRNNQEHFEYLLNWMANAVQYPGRRCEVAIVMRGREGTGKGIAAVYFGGLFGAHCRHISQPKHLTGHFNSHLLHCSVLHADEAFFAGDRSHEGVLKALITEPTILIEPKGIDPFAIPNCLHIIMSSNADWVIPASAEARRYAVFDVDPAHLQDRAYFAAIVEGMEKKGGREALLYLLQHRNLSGFDVRAIPQTQALADQKAHSRRGVDRLIEIIAHDGILPSPHRLYSDVTLTTGGENGDGFYNAARSLVPDLKYDSPIIIHSKLKEDWGCAAWKSGYQRGLKFLPLKELRDRFDKKHGPQKWPVVEGERVEWGDIESDEPSF